MYKFYLEPPPPVFFNLKKKYEEILIACFYRVALSFHENFVNYRFKNYRY